MKVHVFVIESEPETSPTSVIKVWQEIQATILGADNLGRHEFVRATTPEELQDAMGRFLRWVDETLEEGDRVVLWCSIHGCEPKEETLVGTAGISESEEHVEWYKLLHGIKSARSPSRILVLMDVCWGGSPTAPSRLATTPDRTPFKLFGPRRAAYRGELDGASRALFQHIAVEGFPNDQQAVEIVDTLNAKYGSDGQPFYSFWRWEDHKAIPYPALIPRP